MVWWSVCIHVMNQNVYPAHSEDVLAALPLRATRVMKRIHWTLRSRLGLLNYTVGGAPLMPDVRPIGAG
jgi:hypothetical protein